MIIAYPLVRAIYLSFTDSSPLVPTTNFVGLSNFTSIFAGGATTTAFEFTVVFALCSTAVEILAGASWRFSLAGCVPGSGG